MSLDRTIEQLKRIRSRSEEIKDTARHVVGFPKNMNSIVEEADNIIARVEHLLGILDVKSGKNEC